MTDADDVTDTADVDRSEVLVRLEDVRRIHGEGVNRVAALDGVTLHVHSGELIALMGPSGSGKSTLLHLAGGLDVPTTGTVSVLGIPVSGMSRTRLAALRRRWVGYVFQDLNLVSTLTLAENVALPLELDGMSRQRARDLALLTLDRVGVAHLADRFPEDVSGGQRQRGAIARALVGDRRILLADEPTGALDSATGDEVMGVIRALVDGGAGAVVATHDPRLASWADRVVFMQDGRIRDVTSAVASTTSWPWGTANEDTGEIAAVTIDDAR